jgi:hypothetical protein
MLHFFWRNDASSTRLESPDWKAVFILRGDKINADFLLVSYLNNSCYNKLLRFSVLPTYFWLDTPSSWQTAWSGSQETKTWGVGDEATKWRTCSQWMQGGNIIKYHNKVRFYIKELHPRVYMIFPWQRFSHRRVLTRGMVGCWRGQCGWCDGGARRVHCVRCWNSCWVLWPRSQQSNGIESVNLMSPVEKGDTSRGSLCWHIATQHIWCSF